MRTALYNAERRCEVTIPRQTQKPTKDAARVERLAIRLSHPNLMTRTKAARLLGELGDPAAIPHLQEALRRSYTSRSPGLHSVVGWFVTMAVALGCTLLFLVFALLFQSAPTSGYSEFGVWLADLRRNNDPFVRACITAMAQIAERDSSPESSAIVPFLRGIAADPLHHSGETRATARLAAERIEDRTREIKHMPLAARAPEVEPAHLPVVALRSQQ